MHAWLVWCWAARVWSVDGHVVAAAVVLLVQGRVSRLMVGLFGVGSLALQRAPAHSDVVRVVAMLVSVLVDTSCVRPAWYVLTVRRPLIVGEKSNDRWSDRCEKFPNSVLHSLFALAALHAQSIIPYFAMPFGRLFSFACAIHMYTPVGGKAPSVPLGASPCSPWEPQGAAPAHWCGARVPVWLPVVCLIVPCLAGYVAGVSVSQCGVWRLGWLGSCSGVGTLCPVWRAGPSVTPPCSLAGAGVFAGPMWRAFCPLRAPAGVRNKGILVSVEAPPRSLALLTFRAAGKVSLVPFLQVTCAECAPAYQDFNFPVGGARRSHRRRYPLFLALEDNILDNCSITFPWSSAGARVPRVWLPPWPGPLWVRFAEEEG